MQSYKKVEQVYMYNVGPSVINVCLNLAISNKRKYMAIFRIITKGIMLEKRA